MLDDGDEDLIPNDWLHKVVRVGGGVAGGLPRFGGSYLIHLDSKLAIQLWSLRPSFVFWNPFIPLMIYSCEAGLLEGCGQKSGPERLKGSSKARSLLAMMVIVGRFPRVTYTSLARHGNATTKFGPTGERSKRTSTPAG